MEKFLKRLIYLGLGVIAVTPVFMSSGFFFPFIFTKALIFRVAVEIIFLAYLFLAYKNQAYRPRVNILLVSFFVYLAIVFVSSILGDSFYLSFWGDIERSEGLLMLLHLAGLFAVISGVIKEKRDWLTLFDATIVGSLIVSVLAVGQKFNWDFVSNSGDARVSATIGNPAFLAAYLIFAVFFAAILFFERKGKFLKLYYLATILLELYIIFLTATRGAFVGLVVSFFIAATLTIFFTKTDKKIKRGFSLAVILVILFGFFTYVNKDAAWVKNNGMLNRITSISLKDRTTETRLLTWKSSWEGIKEKPILGWGYENFYLVFNKHFEPGIYEDAGSRIWFDRAHNVIFDRAVTGGFLGLFAYLFIIFYPAYFFAKKLLKKEEDESDKKLSILIFSLLVAYFIQNLFVFDSLVSYIPLIFLLGFSGLYIKEINLNILNKKNVYKYLTLIFLVLFLPIVYSVNIKPAKANVTVISAMRAANSGDQKGAFNLFLKAISFNTYGNQEYRVRLAEFVDTAIYKKDGDETFRREAAIRTTNELKNQIFERPNDAANYILLMRHYNRVYIYDVILLEDVINLFDRAIKLSPTRPHFYYEIAYAEVYSGSYYKNLGQSQKAGEFFDKAITNFKKAIELNDKVTESYINIIVMSMVADRSEIAREYVEIMDDKNIQYKKPEHLKRLASAAVNTKNYEFAARFYGELIKVDPANPQNFIDLSLSYVYSGDIEKAVETAEKVKEFGGPYETQAVEFINKIVDPNFDVKNLSS